MADQRKIEAGREKLAAYKKKKREPGPLGKSSSPSVRSPDTSMDTSTTSNESVSPSPNRQDVVQKLTTRIRDLEELLAGKSAAMQAMQERIDASAEFSADISTGMLSFSLEADYKTHLDRYQTRLEEFSAAVAQRDELIAELTGRLAEVALTNAERDSREHGLTAELALLQQQLRATRDLVQGTDWNTGVDPQQFLDAQNRVLALENSVGQNKAVIDKLNLAIQQRDQELQQMNQEVLKKDKQLQLKDNAILKSEQALLSKTAELERKTLELSSHKTQAAAEVVSLMRHAEELSQQVAQVQAASKQAPDLRLKLEEDFGIQLQSIKEELRNQSALELRQCQDAHIRELDRMRAQNEALELELDSLSTEHVACKSELDACKEAYIAQWAGKQPKPAEVDVAVELRQLHHTEVESLRQEMAALTRQAEEAAAAHKAVAHENALLSAQMDTYKGWLDERTQIAERNGQDVFDLQKELSDYKNQLERLDNRHSANHSAMQIKHEQQLKELAEKLEDVSTKLVGKEKECVDSEAICKKYEEQLKELNNNLETANAKILEKETQCSTHKEQLHEFSDKLNDVIEKLLDKQRECESHSSLLADNMSTCKKYEEQLKELSDKLDTVNTKLSQSAMDCESYKAEIRDLQGGHQSELEEMNVQIQELHSQLSKEPMPLCVESPDSSLRIKIRDLHNLVQHREETHVAVHSQLLDAVAKLHAVQALLLGKEELEQSLLEKEQALHEASQSCDSLKGVKAALEKRLEKLEQSLLEKEQALCEVSQSCDLLKGEKTALENQLEVLEEEFRAAKVSEEHQTELEAKVQDLMKKLENEQRTMQSSLEVEQSSLQKRIQELEEQIGAKSERNQEHNETELILNLRNRIDELEKDRPLLEFSQPLVSPEGADTLLEGRVSELDEQLRATKVALTECNQPLEEAQLIADLRSRVEELESALRELNGGTQTLRETLQETAVQCLSAQTACAAKDELVDALNLRVHELEESLLDVNKMAASMRAESDRMMTQVAKAKELLRRSKVDRDEVMASCKRLEDERDEMMASCKRLEDERDELRKLNVAADEELATRQVKIDNLQFVATRLEQLERDNDEATARCATYEEEVARLREQLASSETSLEGVRQELCNNRAPETTPTRRADRRHTLMLGAGDFLDASSAMNMTEYLEVAGRRLSLVDSYVELETVRHRLEDDAEALQSRLAEKELSTALISEEAERLKTRCTELDAAVGDLRLRLAEAEKGAADRDELAAQVAALAAELGALGVVQDSLREELCQSRVAAEVDAHAKLQEQLERSVAGDDNAVEELICELGIRSKEAVVLREKLAAKEQEVVALHRQLQDSEAVNGRLSARLTASRDEAGRLGTELESAWAELRRAGAEVGAARRDLALATLANQQLTDRLAREADNGSCHLATTALAKLAILNESHPVAAAAAPDSPLDGLDELRGRLEGIFNRDPGVARAGPDSPDRAHVELMAELAFYREQHATLADVLGSTGVLQAALHRRKRQLTQKLDEKESVERQLEEQRSLVSECQLRLAVLEETVRAQDAALAQAVAQRQRAEDELRAIEERLRDKEDSLVSQRHELEGEVFDRDLRLRRSQIECRTAQLETAHTETASALLPAPGTPRRAPASAPGMDHLEAMRRDMNAAHDAALARLKCHLRRVFSAQESEMQARHAGQLAHAHDQHRQQLATIQQQLQENLSDLETKLSQIHDEKEELDVDLEEMKIQLDGTQREVFDVLQKKLKVFGQKQMTAAIERVKSEHERMVANMSVVHSQELIALQYKLEQKNNSELHIIKQDLLHSYEKDLRKVEQECAAELARLKEVPKVYPTDSKSALGLLKHFLCAEFAQSFQALADAHYGQYEKEILELKSQLETAMRLELPEDRDEALELLDSEEELIEQTQGLLARVVTEHARLAEALGGHVDGVNAQLLAFLELTAADVRQAADAAALRQTLLDERQAAQAAHEQHSQLLTSALRERDEATARLTRLLAAAGVECGTCAAVRAETEERHRREVEELRTYFEKKCADVEKHYSEEVFSQHSRKISTDSSSCEIELGADIFAGPVVADNSLVGNSLDSHSFKDFRAELAGAKAALEDGASAEMAALKGLYDGRLRQLAVDLEAAHQANLHEAESKHAKELENVQAQLYSEIENVRSQLKAEHLRELEEHVEQTRSQLEAEHCRELRERLEQTCLELQAKHIQELDERLEQMRSKLKAEHLLELEERSEQIRTELETEHLQELEVCVDQARSELQTEHLQELETMLEQTRSKLQAEHLQEVEECVEQTRAKLQAEHRRELEEHVNQLRSQLQAEHIRELAEQVDEATESIKLAAEQEQEKFMRVQKEITSSFLLQHEQDVRLITQKLEARLHSANAEIHKLTQEHAEYAESILQNKQRIYAEVHEDVLKALENHLQEVLSSERAPGNVPSCPVELAQLLTTFTDRYEQRLAALSRELAATKSANGVESPVVAQQSIELTAQENKPDFRQMASTMKELVRELAKYVVVCEDELNNTLVQQILRTADEGLDDSGDMERCAVEESLSVSTGNTLPFLSMASNLDSSECDGSRTQQESLPDDSAIEPRTPSGKGRRVHFAPDISRIMDMDETTLARYVGANRNLASDVRQELDSCLRRLKHEAAAVMLGSKRQEPEMDHYRSECGRLAAELDASMLRCAELEAREEVSEGYGAQGQGHSLSSLAGLQDQARSILSEGSTKTPQLQLIEELCREGDRLVEESKHERDDLQQQILAADKQLRATRRFLEEQAAEREQERDDFLAEIQRLTEQLRVADQLKAARLDKEVETLEGQVKEASALLKDADAKKDELEVELKAAIDKVWVLRDIISDLEGQVEAKARSEAALEEQVAELRALVEQQSQSNLELSAQLDSGHGEMSAHISDLEDQLRRHHQQMEQFQPESMRQMKTTLREFETTLDKKTKDLESLYAAHNSSASSPCLSEDVSISREQMEGVRSATPEGQPVSLPLTQLLRLQDKMAAHSRAEQAALKQIRDLEMEMQTMRADRDEVVAERDALQTQLNEQLLTISRLRANVDGQRQATDSQVAQACADQHLRWQERDTQARELAVALEAKDKQLSATSDLLEQTRAAVATQEADWAATLEREQDGANKLRTECAELAIKVKQLEESAAKQKEKDTANAAANSKENNLRKVLAAKDAQVATLEGQLKELKSREASALKLALYERDQRILALESALESSQGERQKIERELQLGLEERGRLVAELQAAQIQQVQVQQVQPQQAQAQQAQVQQAQAPTQPPVRRHRKRPAQEKHDAKKPAAADLAQSCDMFESVLRKALETGIESLTLPELTSLRDCALAASEKLAPLNDEAELHVLDKKQLCTQLQTLRKELQDKDNEAQKKTLRLEAAAAAERERHDQARRELEREQLRASDMAAQHERLQQETQSCADAANDLQQQLDVEMSRVRALGAEMGRVRGANARLEAELRAERQRTIESNLEESEIMAAMRARLDSCLETEVQLRARLAQAEANALRHREPPNGTSRKEMQEVAQREQELSALTLALKQERRRGAELEAAMDADKRAAAQRVQAERERSRKLRAQLQAVEEDRENISAQLDSARDALASQQRACAELSRRLSDECERAQAEEQRLRTALAAAETALADRALELQPPDGAPSAPISAPMLNKLKAANALLERHVAGNAEVSLAMSRLTEDRQRLQDKVRQLEAQLARSPPRQRSAAQEAEVVDALLAAERTTWSREKAALLHSLAQAEAASRLRGHSDDADKMRHLFSKYLRVESYRKALAWQKRYLLIVIDGYQNADTRAIPRSGMAETNGMVETNGTAAPASRPAPISRFRSYAVAIIAVHRMKYLVRRWKDGRSVAAATKVIHGSTESLASGTSSYLGTRQRHSSSSWSVSRGVSPPTGLQPLQVAEFIGRFDRLQQRLGLAANPST